MFAKHPNSSSAVLTGHAYRNRKGEAERIETERLINSGRFYLSEYSYSDINQNKKPQLKMTYCFKFQNEAHT